MLESSAAANGDGLRFLAMPDERRGIGMLMSTKPDVGVPVEMSFFPSPRWMIGTCFAFRNSTRFLTAAHCVDEDVGGLSIWCPLLRPDSSFAVTNVVAHPTADIAMIQVSENEHSQLIEPMIDHGKIDLADDYLSYGYPDHSDHLGRIPVGRAYRGYLQRAFDFRSHLGYSYEAGEVSVPVEGGVSGAPLFIRSYEGTTLLGPVAIGVATENVDSRVVVGFYDEVGEGEQEPTPRRETLTTRYGLAALLHHQGEWLDNEVPPTRRVTIHRS